MSYSRRILLLVLVGLLAALAACQEGGETPALSTPVPATTEGGAAPTSAPPTEVPATAEAPTATALPPTPTVAAPATTAPNPTATASPTPVPPAPEPPEPQRINFGAGATSATVQGTLAAGGDTDNWLVRAQAGQVLTTQTTTSAIGQVVVSVRDPNGNTLISNTDNISAPVLLPATGDYSIDLSTVSGSGEVQYTMTVTIPPVTQAPTAPPPTAQPAAERLTFAPGATSATVTGVFNAGGDFRSYVLRVLGGQTIVASVQATILNTVTVVIQGPSGQILATGTDAAALSAVAPADGDYFINLSTPNNIPAAGYTLTVTVPAPQQPAEPVRIVFQPNSTVATTGGTLPQGGGSMAYILRLLAGQTMIINLAAVPPGAIDIRVTDVQGQVLSIGRDPTSLAVTVPANGDYIVNFSSAAGSAAISYTAEFVVPPGPGADAPQRIEFATGAISATVNGVLAAGGDVDTWVLRALAGQTMNVSFTTIDQPQWASITVYNTRGDIIGVGTGSSGPVAVPLVEAGDYTIVVNSQGQAPAITYAMMVTVQ